MRRDLTARLRRSTAWIVRHRRAAIAALASLSLLVAAGIARLHLEVDPDSNLPQAHPAIRALNELHELFGDKNLVVVGLFPNDGQAFRPAFLSKVDEVTRGIADLPGVVPSLLQSIAAEPMKDVRPTDDGFSVTPLMEHPPGSRAEADALRERVFDDPSYVGTLVSADASAVAIYATFELTPELPAYEDVYRAVRRAVERSRDGSFRAAFSGPVVLAGAAGEASARIAIFFPFALLVIGLVHYDAFRTAQAIFLPLLTALLAVAWALGAMGWMGVPIDPFNATTPILILAVAAGHAVQILKRYYEAYARLGDNEAAVIEATAEVGTVMLAAGTIAALAFLSLATIGTRTIATFGLFTALGIVATLVIELTLIPAVRASLRPGGRELVRERAVHPWIDGMLARFARTAGGLGAKRLLLGTAALLVVAGLLSLRVQVDTSFKRLFSDDSKVRTDDDLLNRTFAGTSTLVFLIEGPEENAIARPDALRAIERFERRMEALPGVGKALSVVDTLGRLHRTLNDGRPSTPLPERQALAVQYLFLYSLSGGDDLATRITPDNRIAKVVVMLEDDSTRFGAARIADARRLLDELLPEGFRYRVAGTLASNGALTEVLAWGKLENIAQIALISFVVASLLFRSALAGLLVVVPLLVAVVVNFGAMGALGIPLDVATATIAAMAVGIGADYAVYFLFRLRAEMARTRDRAAAYARAYDTSGKAIVFVSSAIAAGYATLCVSDFALHVRLGGLVALAMVSSSLAALTVLPALATVLSNRWPGVLGGPWPAAAPAVEEEAGAPLPARGGAR